MANSSAPENILKYHMGDSFYRLAPLLQRFHVGKKTLVGKADVEHGNVIARFICWVMGFPREGSGIALQVECDHGATMSWRRKFNGQLMGSTFSLDRDGLVESLNSLQLYLRAIESNGELHYQFYGIKFLGLPLPTFLCPQIVAYERDNAGKYQFYVAVKLWLIGPVIRYWGILELIET